MPRSARATAPKPLKIEPVTQQLADVPLRDQLPLPPLDPADVPAALDPQAAEIFTRVAAELVNAGRAATVDRDMLALYAKAMSRWIAAEAKVDEFGPVVEIAGVPTPSPYLAVSERAARQVAALAQQLGLSPQSRRELK